eukprot:jgi/Botrbrau1/14020/Bobra.0310s0007.1
MPAPGLRRGDGGRKGSELQREARDLEMFEMWKCTGGTEPGAGVPLSSLDKAPGYPSDLEEWARARWRAGFETMKDAKNPSRYADARKIFEEVVALAPARLHPCHVTVFDCYMPLMNCCRGMRDLPAAINALNCLNKAMDQLEGHESVERGNVWELLGSLFEVMAHDSNSSLTPAQRKQHLLKAREAVHKAVQIRKLTLGDTNIMTQQTAIKLRSLPKP